MIKVILAVVAILVLAVSANAGNNRSPQVAFDTYALDDSLIQSMFAPAARLTRNGASSTSLARFSAASETAPAPALLVYFMLILVGSAVSVGVVRQTQRRDG